MFYGSSLHLLLRNFVRSKEVLKSMVLTLFCQPSPSFSICPGDSPRLKGQNRYPKGIALFHLSLRGYESIVVVYTVAITDRPSMGKTSLREDSRRLPIIRLARELRPTLQGGHPWIYREALEPSCLKGKNPGFVEVHDRHGFLAYGIYDPYRPIAVRILSRNREEFPCPELFEERLRQAHALRERIIPPGIGAFRWVHGEADGLPGVVLDRYGPILVLRSDGPGMQPLVKALLPLLLNWGKDHSIEVIIHRRSRGDPEKEKGEILWGKLPPLPIWIQEYDYWLGVDPLMGQKTGLFLDQRENRRRIADLKISGRALNLFAYTGGFGLAAYKAGAESIVEVDISPKAKEQAQRNWVYNGFPSRKHSYIVADLFKGFPAAIKDHSYSLIILDPPSLAPNEASVPKAKRAYLYLLIESLKLLERGGLLAASSCSTHIHEDTFLALLARAAERLKRSLTILGIYGAPPDHPLLPAFPEGRYLKFILARG